MFSLEILLGIHNGTILNWNDPLIRRLNPTSYLPNDKIVLLYRRDTCGTNYLISKSFSSFSQEYANQYGTSSSPNYPVRHDFLIESSLELAKYVDNFNNSIALISLGVIKDIDSRVSSSVITGTIQNQVSKVGISPDRNTLRNAVSNSKSNKNSTYEGLAPEETPSEHLLDLFNVLHPQAYPLAHYHYICMNRQQGSVEKAKMMFHFLDQWYYIISLSQSYLYVDISKILLTRISKIYSDNLYCGKKLCKFTSSQESLWWIVIIVILMILILLMFLFFLLIIGIFVYKKFRKPKSYVQYDKKSRNNQLTQSLILNQITINSNQNITNIKYDEIILEDQIGSGSFSEVYRGKWLGTTVAIKRILITGNQDDESDPLNDFIKETSLMATLRHPNVIQYLGTSVKIPHLYLITEFCEKGNVQSALRDKSIKLTVTKTVEMALDAAKGMLYLHSSKPPILHRDFKSANLLIDKNWTVKVADFGLSRVLDTKKEMTVCGTPETCAPEVLSRNSYTEKADVYSFGIVLWEMLTRDKLYPGMNFYELSSKVVNEDLRPDIKNYKFPDELLNLMTSCWDNDPSKRPSFEEIVDILEIYLNDRIKRKKKKEDKKDEDKQELLQDFK